MVVYRMDDGCLSVVVSDISSQDVLPSPAGRLGAVSDPIHSLLY